MTGNELCIILQCYGNHIIVYNKKGEITRRELGIKKKYFFVKFPYIERNINFTTEGADVIKQSLIKNRFKEIHLPAKEKKPMVVKVNKYKYIPSWHSPASIDVKKGLIVYNKRFTTFSEAKRIFIIQHEIGHFFYKTEKYCDLFATKQLLSEGFGKSQCLEVLRNTLKDSNEKNERYDYVASFLI